jgi:hypothetical protein
MLTVRDLEPYELDIRAAGRDLRCDRESAMATDPPIGTRRSIGEPRSYWGRVVAPFVLSSNPTFGKIELTHP